MGVICGGFRSSFLAGLSGVDIHHSLSGLLLFPQCLFALLYTYLYGSFYPMPAPVHFAAMHTMLCCPLWSIWSWPKSTFALIYLLITLSSLVCKWSYSMIQIKACTGRTESRVFGKVILCKLFQTILASLQIRNRLNKTVNNMLQGSRALTTVAGHNEVF